MLYCSKYFASNFLFSSSWFFTICSYFFSNLSLLSWISIICARKFSLISTYILKSFISLTFIFPLVTISLKLVSIFFILSFKFLFNFSVSFTLSLFKLNKSLFFSIFFLYCSNSNFNKLYFAKIFLFSSTFWSSLSFAFICSCISFMLWLQSLNFPFSSFICDCNILNFFSL